MSDNVLYPPFPAKPGQVGLDRPGMVGGGGSGPHDPGMEALVARVDRIETRLDGIDIRLRAVEQAVSAVGAKVDLLTDRIVSKLPTWWQMPAVMLGTLTAAGALLALYAKLHALGWW